MKGTFSRNVVWGVKFGLAYAGVLVLYSLLQLVLLGGEHFEAFGTSWVVAASVYALGGIAAGAVVGAMRPFAGSPAGAAVIGFAAAVPVWILIFFATSATPNWTRSDTVGVVLLSVIVGVPAGLATGQIWRH